MEKLALPQYQFKIKSSVKKTLIFDIIRKKYFVLTPEEWVRQHFIHYLIHKKKYPISLIAVEKQLTVNNLNKRSDILVFNREGKIEIVIECKAPKVKISQNAFDQIARYNLKLQSNYLIVTNGLVHFYCKMDYEKEAYIFLEDFPSYKI